MGRMARLKLRNPKSGYYHITSRTVLKSFLLDEMEKEYFLKLLKKLSRVYFVKVATFAIMSNHFHLIVQMVPSEEISDEELQRRFNIYYNEGKPKKNHRPFERLYEHDLRRRWGDISCFIQDLKQRFSRWYNRIHDGHGHVWAERFKSVLLQGDRALLACMVYVELNSVRAGIVNCPEEYRFCGLSHFLTGGRAAHWLDFSTLTTILPSVRQSLDAPTAGNYLKRYLEIIYHEGMVEREGKASIPLKDVERAQGMDFSGSEILSFRRRIRYFTEGVILGSRSYCEEKYHEFRSYFGPKREKDSRIITYKQHQREVSAPENHLLHLFSIRSFST